MHLLFFFFKNNFIEAPNVFLLSLDPKINRVARTHDVTIVLV